MSENSVKKPHWNVGRTHTPEARLKIGAASKGHIKSAETRAKMSAALKGRTPDPHVLEASRKANTGRKHTPEAKARMAAKRPRRPKDFVLDQVTVNAMFHYQPGTGVFTRKMKTGNCTKVGEIVGSINNKGYLHIRVWGKKYLGHRLAWLYMTGVLPDLDIDHRNGDRADNRWENLRVATDSENLQNLKKARSDNKTGYLGVHQKHGRFYATIKIGDKNRDLGSFETPAEAHEVYLASKRVHHKGCTI